MEATPVGEPVGKPRARKRAKGAPTHVRSWPLRPDAAQCREIGTRFFTGVRLYNAVLGEFIARSRKVKSDPAWQAARELPRRTKGERAARRAAFDAVAADHGFTAGAAQSFASSLRKSWVRDHLPAQETQNLGARAFDAVNQWHLRRKGKPRFKSTKRGLHSLAAKDGLGALRPKTDAAGRLVGLQWGAGFVIGIAVPAHSGRRGREQQVELAEIEALIAAGKVLSTRIVRTVINGADTYRMQLVCDGHPTRRHRVGDGRVSFDLGPSQIAVAVQRADGSWSGWVEPLAMRSGWTRCGCAGRSGIWIVNTAPAHRTVSPKTSAPLVAVGGSVRPPRGRPRSGWPNSSSPGRASPNVAWGAGQPIVGPRHRDRLRKPGLRVVAEELPAQCARPGTGVTGGDDAPQG